MPYQLNGWWFSSFTSHYNPKQNETERKSFHLSRTKDNGSTQNYADTRQTQILHCKKYIDHDKIQVCSIVEKILVIIKVCILYITEVPIPRVWAAIDTGKPIDTLHIPIIFCVYSYSICTQVGARQVDAINNEHHYSSNLCRNSNCSRAERNI